MMYFLLFEKSIVRNQEKPIERAIAELCGEIQCVKVVNDKITMPDGRKIKGGNEKRFEL
jgi:hypothetical protein